MSQGVYVFIVFVLKRNVIRTIFKIKPSKPKTGTRERFSFQKIAVLFPEMKYFLF